MSKRQLRVWIIRPNHTFEATTVEDSLAVMQELVGGDIETIIMKRDAHAFVNTDAKRLDLPVNLAGTIFLARTAHISIGDPIRGNVVVLGDGYDGTEADVPMWVTTEIGRIARERKDEEA